MPPTRPACPATPSSGPRSRATSSGAAGSPCSSRRPVPSPTCTNPCRTGTGRYLPGSHRRPSRIVRAAGRRLPLIRVDGRTLRCADVVTAASTEGPLGIDVSIAALRAAEHAWKLAEELSTRRVVYGRTTGVGANKDDTVENSTEHGRRLLRSHAGGSGDPMPAGQVRAMMLIRLNQLLAGRSGISPELIGALAEAVRTGALPLVHRLGAIGTGDLAPLAEAALALTGERQWVTGHVPPVAVQAGDALAFMSSNAATLAEATLAAMRLNTLTRASHAIAALTYVAL